MPRKRPPRHPNSQKNTTSPKLSPPLSPPPSSHQPHQHNTNTNPGPSTPSLPLALPLNFTDADCFALSCHMYLNMKEFDDSLTWWGSIVPFFPNRSVQELRLFSYLFFKSYGELAVDRGWIPMTDLEQVAADIIDNKPLESLEQLGLPSKEDCRTLLEVAEHCGDLEEIAGHFPGKNAEEIGNSMSMLRLTAAYMGGINAVMLKRRLRSLERKAEDSQEISEEVICRREPMGVESEDSAPSTSGRPFSSEGSSSSGRGGGRRGRVKVLRR